MSKALIVKEAFKIWACGHTEFICNTLKWAADDADLRQSQDLLDLILVVIVSIEFYDTANQFLLHRDGWDPSKKVVREFRLEIWQKLFDLVGESMPEEAV